MKKRISLLNWLIFGIGTLLFCIIMFYFNLDLGTGKKELENVSLLAFPCFFALIHSLMIDDQSLRKKYCILYLISYFIVMLGFVFSNSRSNIHITDGIVEIGLNVIPFHAIVEMLNGPLGLRFALYNIIGNFLMLTPLAILLPLIFKKINCTKLTLFILILCIGIESVQYLFKIGSFDIDDIILNFLGVTILYLILKYSKLDAKIKRFFLEMRFPKKICVMIYIMLLPLFMFVCLKRCYMIIDYIQEKEIRMDFSHFYCESPEKTYLGDVGNYRYYSKCFYGDNYVEIGKTKQQYKAFSFVQFIDNNINLMKEMYDRYGFEKEKIITDIFIKNKNDNIVLFYNDIENEKIQARYYLFGFSELDVEVDGKIYDAKKLLEEGNIKLYNLNGFIGDTTKLIYADSHNKEMIYSFSKGGKLNVFSCEEPYGMLHGKISEIYYTPSDYPMDKNICNTLYHR